MILLELIFVYSMRKGSRFFFYFPIWPSKCSNIICKIYPFLIELPWHLCLLVRWHSLFCSTDHLSVFMSVPQCFDDYSFIVNLQIDSVSLSTLFFWKILLVIPGSLYFDINLESVCQFPFFKSLQGFWLRLHRIYRSIWGELTS